jgi:hypothetical protein
MNGKLNETDYYLVIIELLTVEIKSQKVKT